MNIFYVLGINFLTLEVFTDLLLDKNEALNLAWKMANKLTIQSPLEFLSTPNEQSLKDHKLWIFAPGPTVYVAVEERTVNESVGEKNFSDLTALSDLINIMNDNLITSKNLDVMIQNVPVDDPYDNLLPGSFNHNFRGITIADIKNNPYSAVFPRDLSEEQRRALVTARVRKRPNFKYFNFNQSAALNELKVKSSFGQQIIDYECFLIDDFITSLSDESSSADESDESSEE